MTDARDPVRRAVSLVLAGRIDEYAELDGDGSLLAAGFDAANGPEQDRLAARAVEGDDPRPLLALAYRMRFGELRGASRFGPLRTKVAPALARCRAWDRLWELARDLPVVEAAAAVHSFHGWRPADAGEAALFGRLARADPDLLNRQLSRLDAATVTVRSPVVRASQKPGDTRPLDVLSAAFDPASGQVALLFGVRYTQRFDRVSLVPLVPGAGDGDAVFPDLGVRAHRAADGAVTWRELTAGEAISGPPTERDRWPSPPPANPRNGVRNWQSSDGRFTFSDRRPVTVEDRPLCRFRDLVRTPLRDLTTADVASHPGELRTVSQALTAPPGEGITSVLRDCVLLRPRPPARRGTPPG